MRRPLIVLLWVAMLFALLPVHAFDAAGYTKGVLWKIDRPGAQASYLFGTIHSEDPRVLAVPAPVQRAFGGAKRYVMEAVLDDAAMASMGAHMMFTDGSSLDRVLDPLLYQRTAAAMAAYGMPEAAVQMMKPWAVAMALSTPRPETGVFLDLALMRRAQEQGKVVAGLESVAEQLAVFDRMPTEEQARMLQEVLDTLPQLAGLFAQLHEAYLARDLGTLGRLYEEQLPKSDPALRRKLTTELLDARNRRMAQRMEAHLQEGDAFIAVGALHLPGANGVLRLLARRGWRLKPVY